MKPTLSVVIPVYNVEKYLSKCIDSVLAQEYKDIEIVLVDDGSLDSSGAVCDEYARKNDNIKVIHKSNCGLSDARNVGIKNATGEYITFLDSDDFWNPRGSISRILHIAMNNRDIDVFVYNSMGIYPDGKKVFRAYKKALVDLKDRRVETYYKKSIELGDLSESACIKLMKRSFILENSLYFTKGIVSEDNEWSFRLLRCAKAVLHIDETLFVYRAMREGSISSVLGLRHIKDMMTIIEMSEGYYRENPHEIERVGKYELAHCAYLWFLSLGILGSIRKEDKREAEETLEKHCRIIRYSSSSKTFLCLRLYNMLGMRITSRILNAYMWLMKNNILSNKTRIVNG